MNTDHLRALIAAVDEGTFDSAADLLGISGSAFSQRIKALEKDVGQVLLSRTVPVSVTAAGQPVLRLAHQVAALENDTRAQLGQGAGNRTTLTVAVNADSLETWFVEVLQQAATWDDAVLQLKVDDQEFTHGLLRSGEVIAAVTDDPRAVSGCSVTELGSIEYWSVGATSLLERYRDDSGELDFTTLPIVDFGVRDRLPEARLKDFAQRNGVREDSFFNAPRHTVPSVSSYARAIESGMGWGLLMRQQIPDSVMDDTHPELEFIPELGRISVKLYWQRWTTGTSALDRLSEAVLLASRHMH